MINSFTFIDLVSLQLGNTALHIACRDGLVEIVQLLCAHKADTALQNSQVSVYGQ